MAGGVPRLAYCRSVHALWVLAQLPTDECVIWPGKVNNKGYPQIDSRFTHAAHRYVWILHHQREPELPELDHTCRTPLCCNPAHLEPVTHAENHRRRAAAMTHCPNGHEYTDLTTFRRKGGSRGCRTCTRAADARRYARDPGRRQRQRQKSKENAAA